MQSDTDVLIVGGGLVGSSLACALDSCGLRVTQVEAEALPRTDAQPDAVAALDRRHFALARRSVLVLDGLGVWPLAREAAHPIRVVEVSSRGDFGTVRIDAAELGLDALGHTIPAPQLGAALVQRVAACTGLTRLAPARLIALHDEDDWIGAEVDAGGSARTLRARLVVGADGTESAVRMAAGIGARRHDYEQTAIVGSVLLSRAHDGCAYERFTPDGPVALLPLAEQRAGFVWTLPAAQAPAMSALGDAAFLAQLQDAFGFRAGRFKRVGKRQSWPLRLTAADVVTAPRTVLVGNAAQTVHPLGAQGFNLGLRDVVALAELLRSCARRAGDPGAPELLDTYAGARRQDRQETTDFSDGLTRLFARRDGFVRDARSLGLAAVARIAPLKQDLAYALMGYRTGGAA